MFLIAYLLVFNTCSSEANDLALQIAEKVTGSTEVLVLQGYVLCLTAWFAFCQNRIVHSLSCVPNVSTNYTVNCIMKQDKILLLKVFTFS